MYIHPGAGLTKGRLQLTIEGTDRTTSDCVVPARDEYGVVIFRRASTRKFILRSDGTRPYIFLKLLSFLQCMYRRTVHRQTFSNTCIFSLSLFFL